MPKHTPKVDMSLTVIASGVTEKNAKLTPGDKVTYMGHLPFGNVSIQRADGERDVANQQCFKW